MNNNATKTILIPKAWGQNTSEYLQIPGLASPILSLYSTLTWFQNYHRCCKYQKYLKSTPKSLWDPGDTDQSNSTKNIGSH